LEDDILIYLRDAGCEGGASMEVVQNCVQWRVLILAVLICWRKSSFVTAYFPREGLTLYKQLIFPRYRV